MSLFGYMLQFITSDCRIYVKISPRYTGKPSRARGRGGWGAGAANAAADTHARLWAVPVARCVGAGWLARWPNYFGSFKLALELT